MRRAHHFVFVAMWAIVTLLAVAGFAAYQISGREAPPPPAAELGRDVGAIAGLSFAAPEHAGPVRVLAEPVDDGAATVPAPEIAVEDLPLDTVPTHGWLSEVQVRALIARYFQPDDVNRAIRVAWCESRFSPTSSNPRTGATGLFQHLPEFWPARAEAVDFPGAEPTDPEANVAAAAHAIYQEGGWDVFTCLP